MTKQKFAPTHDTFELAKPDILEGNPIMTTLEEIEQKKKALVPQPKPEAPAVSGIEGVGWGALEEMDTTDLLVPKIYHQQGLSKFVQDGLAKAGDFCDSLTGQILAGRDEPLEIIIFSGYKTMLVSKLDIMTNKFRMEKTIIVTGDNSRQIAAMPFSEERDGDQYKNSLNYNMYCLLPIRIQELPYVITLGSTKTKVARKINTMLYKLAQLKKPGASVVFELRSVKEQNDSGNWYGLEVTQGRDANKQELELAYGWYVKSKSQNFVAAESAEQEDDDPIPF